QRVRAVHSSASAYRGLTRAGGMRPLRITARIKATCATRRFNTFRASQRDGWNAHHNLVVNYSDPTILWRASAKAGDLAPKANLYGSVHHAWVILANDGHIAEEGLGFIKGIAFEAAMPVNMVFRQI